MLLTLLYIFLGVVSVLMGLAILIQEPKQAGLSGAFGLGGDSQMLGTSPTSGVAKFTITLAVVFFLLCVGVGILAQQQKGSSMLQDDPLNPAVNAVTESTGGDVIGGDDSVLDDGGVVVEDGAAIDGGVVVEDGAAIEGGAVVEDTPAETPADDSNENTTPGSDSATTGQR